MTTKIVNKIHDKYFAKHRSNPVVVERVDLTMMIVGFLSPLATFIQVITIVINRTAHGISIVSWLIYLIVSLAWLLYGFLHKSKPLIVIEFVSVVTNIFIIIEFFIFK